VDKIKLVKIIFSNLVVFLLALLVLARSTNLPADKYERVRAYTRMIEFDYVNWTLDALVVKNVQEAVRAPSYMTIEEQHKLVYDYMDVLSRLNQANDKISQIYADPKVTNKQAASASLSQQAATLREMENRMRPLAESVIQYQVSTVIADLGLGLAGQPIPPVLYHVTPLPNALIISPRNVIRQEEDISLLPEMTTEEMDQLEQQVEKNLDVSALVVPIGGVGTYPTMVMSTTDLSWLLEVVSHEWTHNFLTLRPLGIQYMSSGDMRTINETTANISGKEIGHAVLERYYPELVPPPAPTQETKPNQPAPTPTPENPNAFNFNREMHTTRVRTDELLAAEKIAEAEQYMEQRRQFFHDHGYLIRKLNQAYFAFYGAYNDVPGGGAGGTDPIGPAVQELRKRSKSLAEFLNKISWISSFADLQKLIQ
jgi:hypothetical protein